MRYLPHTDEEIREMLAVTGHERLSDLFRHVPEKCRFRGEIALPNQLSEWGLLDHFRHLDQSIATTSTRAVLMGAGSYSHYIPEVVPGLVHRSEFVTAYTPYQPEMSQGTLQGIFEYQTLTARLLGMEVANASMYDGASALAEAVLMALRVQRKKNTVAISTAVHPHYRQVVRSYLQASLYTVIELEVGEDGRTDFSPLQGVDDLAAVAVSSPNFFGIIEDLEEAAESIHDAGGLFITCFTEPFAYGLYKNPGQCGADIVCGEGQSFGMPQSFGGPGLGMFACKSSFQRNLPGRLVGQTVDLDGRRGFVLTLATREQHIRREKATSNICSNQGLCAMTAAAYMATLGRTGLKKVARLNFDKAAYLKQKLCDSGAQLLFETAVFNEFALKFPSDFAPVRERLLEKGIIAGLELGNFYPEYKGAYLFCVTETTSKEVLDTVIEEAGK
ncbi:MAG: aminomethyl-transferring glycine dehydrogenase subunit GcvPA [Desulfobulbus sp.]|nr:MAG: aminomethyl-transferring glycine dehydrogenase subunit GcvPA [Desulfobulbus sp.]